MSQSPSRETLPMQLRLPHPWHTNYTIKVGAYDDGLKQFQIQPTNSTAKTTHHQLHKEDLFWTEPKPSSSTAAPEAPSELFARQESIPVSRIFWEKTRPSIGQAWLAAYGLITLYPATDSFIITLQGDKSDDLAADLCRVGLLAKAPSAGQAADHFLFRGSFWQGAGSPFGSRPVWLADSSRQSGGGGGEWEYPPLPPQNFFPAADNSQGQAIPHPDALSTPVRPPKPAPGTVVYSRFVPHLKTRLALSVLDAADPAHVSLFHAWNRHGTPDTHAEHLLTTQRDPSTLPLLARLGGDNAAPAAYFETYWVRDRVSDHLGVHHPAQPFDRGLNVLFPAATARDARAVAALWGAVVHYAFLDDARTGNVYGAPRYVEAMASGYEARFPFSVTRRVESHVAEEALAVCGRELFFGLCPFAGEGEVRVVERERGEDGLEGVLAKL